MSKVAIKRNYYLHKLLCEVMVYALNLRSSFALKASAMVAISCALMRTIATCNKSNFILQGSKMGQGGGMISKMYSSRKKKDKQQKYKKFKYHQYVPPDQVFHAVAMQKFCWCNA